MPVPEAGLDLLCSSLSQPLAYSRRLLKYILNDQSWDAFMETRLSFLLPILLEKGSLST